MSVPRGWHEAWYLGGTQRTSVPSGNERMNQRFHSASPSLAFAREPGLREMSFRQRKESGAVAAALKSP